MMQILPAPGSKPFSHVLVPWLRAGSPRVTLVVKATFTLAPGVLRAPTNAMPVVTRDVHRGGDPRASLAFAAESAPLLPHANVLVIGSAHPGASRALAFESRLTLWNDRGVLVDKPLFVRPQSEGAVPLQYERAPRTRANPVGTARPEVIGATNEDDVATGFGPIAPTWPTRLDLLRGGAAPKGDAMDVEAGFDYRFFNPAPIDQQVPYLRGDEGLRLVRIHPDVTNFVTRLPVAHVKARRGDEPLDLQLDMVVVDAHRWLLSLVWRGNFRRDEHNPAVEIDLRMGEAMPLGPAPTAIAATPWDPGFKPFAVVSAADVDETIVPWQPVAKSAHEDESGSRVVPVSSRVDDPEPSADETAFLYTGLTPQPALPFAGSPKAPAAIRDPKPAALPWESSFSSVAVPAALDVDETLAIGAMRVLSPDSPATPAPASATAREKREPVPLASTHPAQVPESVPARIEEPPMVARPPMVLAAPPEAARASPAAVLDGPATPPPVADIAPHGDPGRRSAMERIAAKQSLSGMDLTGAQLQDLDLSGQVLTGAKLDRADLSRSLLIGAELSGCRLERASLNKADLSRANLDRADLSKADLTGAKLNQASLVKASLERAVLDGAAFDGARMIEARLRNASGDKVSFKNCALSGGDLKQAKLTNSSFEGAKLERIDGTRVDLTGGNLKDANLTDANLRPSNLANTDLRGATLDGADLRDADLSGAKMKGARVDRAKMKGALLKGTTLD